jgi:hypothetical protein
MKILFIDINKSSNFLNFLNLIPEDYDYVITVMYSNGRSGLLSEVYTSAHFFNVLNRIKEGKKLYITFRRALMRKRYGLVVKKYES